MIAMGVSAFVLIMAKRSKEGKVLEKIREITEVKQAHLVYGEYDIVMEILADSLDELNNVMLKKLRGVSEIEATNTLIAI